jgi:hypothetical protein
MINYGEVALDLIYATAAEKLDAYHWLAEHWVRLWASEKQQIKLVDNNTRYDGPRRAPNLGVLYRKNKRGEGHCRLTGEPYCLHLEWRIRGARPLKAAGISSPADLASFDFRSFWRKKLRFYQWDDEQVGRYLRNRRTSGRTRKPVYASFSVGRINLDRRTGRSLYLTEQTKWGYSPIQAIVRRYRNLGVMRALTPIGNAFLLPTISEAYESYGQFDVVYY